MIMIISILFGLLVLLTGYLTLFLKKNEYKAIFFCLFVATCIFTWQETLGVPNDFVFFHQTGKVVAQRLDEPRAVIYIWIVKDGTTVPFAYSIPWVMDTAKQLHEAEKNGTHLKVELPSLKEKIKGELAELKNGGQDKTGKKGNGAPGGTEQGNGPPPPKADQIKIDPTKAYRDPTNNSNGKPVFYPDMDLTKLPPKTSLNN